MMSVPPEDRAKEVRGLYLGQDKLLKAFDYKKTSRMKRIG